MNKILIYVSVSLSLCCPSFVYAVSHTYNSDGTSSTTQTSGGISHTYNSDGTSSTTQES